MKGFKVKDTSEKGHRFRWHVPASRATLLMVGAAFAVPLTLAGGITNPVLADTPSTASGDIVVNNQTGKTQDGSPMSGPGVQVGDYYYSVGASAIAASAGGSGNMVLYKGKDWLHKGPALDANGKEIIIAGPATTYIDPDTGNVVYPFANAKSERVSFTETPDHKFIVWVHWEMNSDYNASEVLGLIADKVEGPYKIYSNHKRPGASTVDAAGQHTSKVAGSDTDFASAMGDRVGGLIGDPYTIGADGKKLAKPAQPSYPESIHLTNDVTVNADGTTLPQPWVTPAGQNMGGDASFGTSQTGNAWTYQFNDLRDTLHLKASAVRMTQWDTSAYTNAKSKLDPKADNGSFSPQYYVQQYPAAKTDNPADEGKFAAGVDGSGYAGKTKTGVDALTTDGAYDPNTQDTTTPKLGQIDSSAVFGETISFDKNANVAVDGAPSTPLISPRVDENVGANKNQQNTDSKVVVVRPNDVAYVTNTSVATATATVWVTTDGSDPTDPKNTKRFAYNSRWNPYPISITDGMTMKAATQTGDESDGSAKYSDLVSETFKVASDTASKEYQDVPIFEPVSTHPGGTYKDIPAYQELKVFEPSFGVKVYYTMDGSDPVPARYGQNLGFGSRDYTIINDTTASGGDGKAYFVTAADDQYMRVWQLNDSMTAVVPDKEYDLDVGKHREAPQLIRGPQGDHLYMLTSGQSGWYKNQAQYQRTNAKYVSDGFSQPQDEFGYRNGESSWTGLQPFADNTTYNSQVGGVFNLGTKDNPNYLFSGSRWEVGDLENSTTIWLPMTIDDNADGTGAAGPNVTLDGVGEQGEATVSEIPTYKSEKGVVSVKYSDKVDINPQAGTVSTDPTVEQIKISTAAGELDKVDPNDHTPRVIDYQKEQQLDPKACDIPNGNGWQTCPGGALEKKGIVRNYSISTAFDGKDWDMDNYDGNEEVYQGTGLNFYTTLDLGQERDLKTIGLSFKSVGGSDNAHRYTVYGSNDNQKWTLLVNNNQNNVPGFKGHDLSGNKFRYIKFQNSDNVDMAHGKSGQAWSRGLYEMTISATKLSTLNLDDLNKLIDNGQQLVGMSTVYTADSLAALKTKLATAEAVQEQVVAEGQNPKHTQKNVDDAASTLYNAIKNLKLIGRAANATTDRVAGADRWATSVDVSKTAYPTGAAVAFVASGTSFPDALSAGPAAAKLGGPVLLTASGTLPSVVQAELKRLKPKKIVIIGGAGAVSTSVEAQLKKTAAVTRVSGIDRYETSRAVATYAFGSSGASNAIVATGADFPDALSAGAAIGKSGPVVLVRGLSSNLDAATKKTLGALKPGHIYVAGGTGVVSEGIFTGLDKVAVTSRLAGLNRFATAVAINAKFFKSADRVLLTNGATFPDALAASAWAPTISAPLFPVQQNCVPAATLSAIEDLGATKVTLIGGTGALGKGIENLAACLK